MKTHYGARMTRAALLPSILALGLVLLTACASAPAAPTASLTEAREAIARAEQSDARQHAGGDLDQARQKLEMAEGAVERQDMVEAERLANESEVAAVLALARTEAAKAAEVNREMERAAEALTEEMRRMGEQQ